MSGLRCSQYEYRGVELLNMWCLWAYSPVIRLARAGEQMAVGVKPFSNTVLSAASASMFGVRTRSPP